MPPRPRPPRRPPAPLPDDAFPPPPREPLPIEIHQWARAVGRQRPPSRDSVRRWLTMHRYDFDAADVQSIERSARGWWPVPEHEPPGERMRMTVDAWAERRQRELADPQRVRSERRRNDAAAASIRARLGIGRPPIVEPDVTLPPVDDG